MKDRIIFCAFPFVERLLIDDITIRSCEKNIIAILSCLRSCFPNFFPPSCFNSFLSFHVCMYCVECLFVFLFLSFFRVKTTIVVASLDCAMISDFPLN
jgi:hypothetical protein